jgi:hypothetical protein
MRFYFLLLLSLCVWACPAVAEFEELLTPISDIDTPALDQFLLETDNSFSTDLLHSHDTDLARDLMRNLRTDLKKAKSQNDKEKLYEYVAYGLQINDSGIWQPSMSFLSHAKKHDFSDTSYRIVKNVTGNDYFQTWLVQVYGAAGIQFDQLSANIEAGTGSHKITPKSDPLGWNSLTALAKNGDTAATESILEYIRTLPAGWYLGQEPLMRNLRYISQPECIELLTEVLFDDTIHHFILNPERSMDIPAASYAAEELSRMLQDFPFKPKDGAVPWSRDEILSIREWVENYSGPWKIEDFRDELKEPVLLPEEGIKLEAATESIAPETVLKPSIVQVGKPSRSLLVEATAETPEESTSWLLWLIGVLVVLGGIALVVRRKN